MRRAFFRHVRLRPVGRKAAGTVLRPGPLRHQAFYYTVVDNTLYFASEMKALLPFLPSIETNPKGFQDYLVFQFCMEGRTLFQGIEELEPAHRMTITADGSIKRRRYWQVYYRPDIYHTEQYFHDELEAQFQRSIKYHVRKRRAGGRICQRRRGLLHHFRHGPGPVG